MIQVLMIAHALTAVFLLGALTHQAFSVSRVSAAQKSNTFNISDWQNITSLEFLT